MQLKYLTRFERIESIKAEYAKRYPGRSPLKLSYDNDNFEYVISGPTTELRISDQLAETWNPQEFADFLRGRMPG